MMVNGRTQELATLADDINEALELNEGAVDRQLILEAVEADLRTMAAGHKPTALGDLIAEVS